MKKNIEEFVRSEREAFDHLEVPHGIWQGIYSTFFAQPWWNSLVLWRSAAVILLLVSAGLFFFPRQQRMDHESDMMSEFKHVEEYYTQEIKDRLVQLEDQKNGLNGLTKDFHQLEAMYAVLRESMQREPTKEIKDALELNLLVRVDLLNQRLEKLKPEEKKPAGKVDV